MLLQIILHLSGKRLDKFQVKDVRQWLEKLATICQYCARAIKGAAALLVNVAKQRGCRPT
jgi:hypothetical protein